MGTPNCGAQSLSTPEHGIQLIAPTLFLPDQRTQAAALRNLRAQPVVMPIHGPQLAVPPDQAAQAVVLPECRAEPVAPPNQRPCLPSYGLYQLALSRTPS